MSLYLKYRPQDFDNLVGQDFIKNTLKAAISQEKTVGAYLFCGPRGTGKTSSARLFAKSINCLDQKDGNPCNACNICTGFQENSLVDIVEIDAASNTGVDNVREIIEKSQFAPTQTKYKIYIIDEVHMLSTGAFNALLKILEEPPTHVKFILATTETHKVPETIISRCQRYDFQRIGNLEIQQRLKYIASQENIQIDEESLAYIIEHSRGGMRDAISLFEQLIENHTISFTKLQQQIGLTDTDTRTQFIAALLDKNVQAIELFENIVSEGKNTKLFLKDVVKKIKNNSIEKLSANNNISKEIFILEILSQAIEKTRGSNEEEMIFTVAILKILAGTTSTPPAVQNQPTKTPAPTKKTAAKTDELNTQDLNDIFATEGSPIQEENFSSGTAFDVKTLTAEIKKLGGKAALTMSIRGATVSKDTESLNIKTPTKIAYNTISKDENRALILEAMKNIGEEVQSLKIQ